MTLGWILEDAWDAYLEALPTAEPPPPEPARIRCPFCMASFSLARELTDHLGDQHRGERPILLLRGLEPAQLQHHRIGTSLRRADVILQNCSAAIVSVNAGPQQTLAPAALRRLLSSQTDALIDMQLSNQFDPAAQPIPAAYRILFSIPEKRSLDAVDRAFHKHLAHDSPDFLAVDRFLNDRACTGLARAYAGALADYVRGLLTKDRPYHVQVTMPFAHYRALYSQAVDGLQPYRRPLPDLVCAVIRFAQNTFSTPSVTGFTPLDGAVRSLAGCIPDMPAIRSGLVERFGRRVPRLPNGDRIIAEGAAWIAHDGLRLTLAKPIEVRVADGSGAGHYHTLIDKGLSMPMENQSVSVANSQFVCADPRNGIAVFEFVKPTRVGLVQAGEAREMLCSLSVDVNPKTEPLFERLHCEVRLDHDYVAHVQIRSQGRGAVAEAEIHRLDFGLAMLPASSESDTDGAAAATGSSPRAAKPQGTARIHGKAGAVTFRPNIVPFDGKTADLRYAVAGDVARIFWPAMFNPDASERTRRQHEEAMYYTPCSVCGRNAYQIEVEGAGPKCGPRCFQQDAGKRLAG